MVDDDVDRHRERGEEHVVGEVQSEHHAQVEADLEVMVALERLDQEAADHGRGLEHHDHGDEGQEAAGQQDAVRHRRRVRDLGHARVAILPHQLARVQDDEQVEDGARPLRQDRPGHEDRDRPRGRVEDGAPTFQPMSTVRPAQTTRTPANQRLPAVSASERRATASVCRTRVRSPKFCATTGTADARRAPVPGDGIRRSFRRRPASSGCANRNRACSSASTAPARPSQSRRFQTSSAGNPTSRVFRSAAVQYRVSSRARRRRAGRPARTAPGWRPCPRGWGRARTR